MPANSTNTCSAQRVVTREAEPRDLEGVAEVEEECFDEETRYPRWLFEEYLRLGAVFRVAPCNGVLVGYVVARLEGSECHVDSIAVKPGFRGRGIGTRLLSEALEECKKRGARAAYLEVDVENPAVKLYEKLGFRIVGVVKNYYGIGRNAYVMYREL